MPATSNLARMFDAAKDTVANTATFTAWAGGGSVATAKAHIHVGEIPAASMVAAQLPRVRLDDAGFEMPTVGEGHLFGGELKLTFYDLFDDSANADSLEAQKQAFQNNVGAVLDEMADLSESTAGAYLFIRRISPDGSITFPERGESGLGQLISASYLVAWGPEGVSE